MGLRARLIALVTGNAQAYSEQMQSSNSGAIALGLDALVVFVRSAEVCPLRMPWFSRHMAPQVRELRDLTFTHDSSGARYRGLRAMLGRGGRFLCWPFVVTGLGLLFVRKYRHGLPGVTPVRQMTRVIRLAFLNNIAPSDAYTLRFVEQPEKADDGAFFTQREHYTILAVLQPGSADIGQVNNKTEFERFLRTKGFPTPAILWPSPGAATAVSLPAEDLFAKPRNAYGGRGARLFEYRADPTPRWNSGGSIYDQDELCTLCEQEGLILQRRLTNHPVLSDLCGSGLSTLRIVTLLYPDQHVETLCAVMRMPVDRMILDNYSAGGLVANVDLESGRTQAAVAKDFRTGVITRHPNSGASILGFAFPGIREACALCEGVHGHLDGLTSR